jgi:hypothetical protein
MNTVVTDEVVWGYRPKSKDLTVAELSALSTDELLTESEAGRADLVAAIERSREARGAR